MAITYAQLQNDFVIFMSDIKAQLEILDIDISWAPIDHVAFRVADTGEYQEFLQFELLGTE